jgi:hypothetical protein
LDIFLPLYTFKVNLKFMGFPKGRHAIIGRACGVAQSGDPRCTSGVAQYGKLRIYNRAGAESHSWTYNAFERGKEFSECWMWCCTGLGGSNL